MQQTLAGRMAMAAMAFAFPIAAIADVSGTVTLSAGSSINLDTGSTVTTGGDLLWSGTSLAPQGKAKDFNVGPQGAALYNVISATTITSIAAGATASTIAASSLSNGSVIIVVTNGGNSAKMLVTAVATGGSLTFQFTTFGATGGSGGGTGSPTVTTILNNSSRVPVGFPNYGIAPSSLFVIKGSGMSDPGDPVLQDSSKVLQTTLNGASISVTVNGTTVQPAIYYTCGPSTVYTDCPQIAAVLPRNTPVGTGTLTVSYKGVASAPATIQVVQNALGINNYNNGLGAVTDTNGTVFSFTHSASPGDNAVIWATGLGADPNDSDTTYTSSPHSVSANMIIYVGGQAASIGYQGASVYPGVNQINIVLPQSTPTGCWVPIIAVVNNVVSNVVTIPVNKGGGVCVDPSTGFNGTQITQTGGLTTVKAGTVAVVQSTSAGVNGAPTTNGAAIASFSQVTGVSYSGGGSVSVGACTFSQTVFTGSAPTVTGLDAGTITLTGPDGNPVTLTGIPQAPGIYTTVLASGAIPTSGGSFVFKGAGGSQVGPFTATLNFPNPLLSWTNQGAAATVVRSNGLLVTWTGGAPGSYVTISGASTSNSVTGSYTCISPVAAQQFTVPSYILLGLPTGNGSTSVQNSTAFGQFSASGIDIGTTFGAVSFSAASKYN